MQYRSFLQALDAILAPFEKGVGATGGSGGGSSSSGSSLQRIGAAAALRNMLPHLQQVLSLQLIETAWPGKARPDRQAGGDAAAQRLSNVIWLASV